jgi:dTDP-glucose pyrophosphorylase
MIFYVLDNLKITDEDNIFIIYYNLDTDNFKNLLVSKYSNIHFIKLNKQTSGAAETIYIGTETIKTITNCKKCMLLDCDTFYTEDILNLYRNININAVYYTLNYELNPIYLYIQLDSDNKIIEIIENISKN